MQTQDPTFSAMETSPLAHSARGSVVARKLQGFLTSKKDRLEILGLHQPSALALLVTTHAELLFLKPHLFVFATDDEAVNFQQSLQFFSPHLKAHILPHFDVSPFSGLYPNRRSSGDFHHYKESLKWG